jgi:hypothetical protein
MIHSGNLKPMDFLQVELLKAKPDSKEPRMQCNGQGKCRKLYYAKRSPTIH